MGADEALPQPAVAENSLDDIRLSTFDETDDLHCAATFGTFQWKLCSALFQIGIRIQGVMAKGVGYQ